jgi:hypothetical protein
MNKADYEAEIRSLKEKALAIIEQDAKDLADTQQALRDATAALQIANERLVALRAEVDQLRQQRS